MICRHCNEHPVSRPRGLCWTCYYNPTVRDRYPLADHCVCGPHARSGGSMKLPEPTDARPGSEDKIAILAERVRLGMALFHPDDSILKKEDG